MDDDKKTLMMIRGLLTGLALCAIASRRSVNNTQEGTVDAQARAEAAAIVNHTMPMIEQAHEAGSAG